MKQKKFSSEMKVIKVYLKVVVKEIIPFISSFLTTELSWAEWPILMLRGKSWNQNKTLEDFLTRISDHLLLRISQSSRKCKSYFQSLQSLPVSLATLPPQCNINFLNLISDSRCPLQSDIQTTVSCHKTLKI